MNYNKKNSAVLLIDFLEEFVYGKKDEVLLPKNRSKKLIANALELIEKAKEKKVKVIHVHCFHDKNDPIFRLTGIHAVKGRKKTKTIDELNGLIDFTVYKKTYDGFYKTKLEKLLRKIKVKNLFLAGIQSDCCVMATGFSAVFNGFNVFPVKGCVETRTKKRQAIAMERLNKLVGEVISIEKIKW
ncbi:cysteine hydrolase [Candidatus Micrarchaeota archaeon]|nr:cysteine hydrolase [Candidatus Micrarchaeota archaeon]MBU2476039.1 cysteine hydrolase [Candidatus Micrarchaeota archaeon]